MSDDAGQSLSSLFVPVFGICIIKNMLNKLLAAPVCSVPTGVRQLSLIYFDSDKNLKLWPFSGSFYLFHVSHCCHSLCSAADCLPGLAPLDIELSL